MNRALTFTALFLLFFMFSLLLLSMFMSECENFSQPSCNHSFFSGHIQQLWHNAVLIIPQALLYRLRLHNFRWVHLFTQDQVRRKR